MVGSFDLDYSHGCEAHSILQMREDWLSSRGGTAVDDSLVRLKLKICVEDILANPLLAHSDESGSRERVCIWKFGSVCRAVVR